MNRASSRNSGSNTPDGNFRWTAKHSLALGVLCLAQLIESLDVTVVNVALPAIRHDAGFSQGALQWVISAYTVLFGGFLLLGGKSGDILGKRRVFIGGITLFALASLITGIATSAGVLTTGRALQGLSAAFVSPMTLAMIATTFPEGRARNVAFGVWGTTSGVSTSVGVVLGGLLTSGPGWRWIFLINLPIAVLLLWGALLHLPKDEPGRGRRGFDAVGALLVTSGISVAVYACVQTEENGWGSAQTLGLLGAAAAILTLFVIFESRWAKDPIVSFDLFRNRTVSAGNLVSVFVGAALLAMFYCLSLYEQLVLKYSALTTGLNYLPLTVVMAACAFLAPVLIPKIGIRAVVLIGSLLATTGLVLFATNTSTDGVWRVVVVPSLIVGAGLALTFIPMSMAAVTGVKPEQMGAASGVANVTRTLGGALGLAVIASLAAAQTAVYRGAGLSPGDALSGGFSLGFAVAAGLMGAAALTSLLLPGRTSPSRRPVSGAAD